MTSVQERLSRIIWHLRLLMNTWMGEKLIWFIVKKVEGLVTPSINCSYAELISLYSERFRWNVVTDIHWIIAFIRFSNHWNVRFRSICGFVTPFLPFFVPCVVTYLILSIYSPSIQLNRSAVIKHSEISCSLRSVGSVSLDFDFVHARKLCGNLHSYSYPFDLIIHFHCLYGPTFHS